MKIVFCHHNKLSYGGGGEQFIITMSRYLSERGHQVEIRTLPINQDDKGLNIEPPEIPAGVKYIKSWFHKFDADIAYYMYAPALRYFFRTKAKKIAAIHSHRLAFHKFSRDFELIPNSAVLVDKLTARRGLEFYDAIHCNNEETYSLLKKKGLNAHFIMNPIDGDVFYPRTPKRAGFSVLYAGRHEYQKGWDRFVEVARRLPEYEVLYTGSEEYVEGAKSLGRIANQKVMASLYSMADITLAPSRQDTFGNSIVEAAMCGSMVITSDIEIHKRLGLPVVYANDADEIVKAVKEIVGMPYEEYDRRRTELISASQKYGMKNIGPKYEEMFEQVADSGI